MSQRSFLYKKFLSGSDDPTSVLKLGPGGPVGTYAVYARRISGSGTATLAVDGSFKSAPGANDLFSVQTAATVGTGALTNILGTSEDDLFPYLKLSLDRTGTCEVDVYIALM
jgi:hypothetical protein